MKVCIIRKTYCLITNNGFIIFILGVLKFLGWEQIFKNIPTRLPLGVGKDCSDFDPKGKRKVEIRCFFESVMIKLHHYLHPSTGLSASDIGVGGRGIGYLYGQYKGITTQSFHTCDWFVIYANEFSYHIAH